MAIKVEWNSKACCHSGNCVRTLPAVFAVEDGKFVIRPEAAPADEVARAVRACPGAALSLAQGAD